MSAIITIHGRMVRDPELKTSKNGSEYCRFCIASDHFDGKENCTDYFECIAGGSKGVAISKYFTKGREIVAHGFVETKRAEKDGVKLTYWNTKVTDFEFCGKKSDAPEPVPDEPVDEKSGMAVVDTEELPF